MERQRKNKEHQTPREKRLMVGCGWFFLFLQRQSPSGDAVSRDLATGKEGEILAGNWCPTSLGGKQMDPFPAFGCCSVFV